MRHVSSRPAQDLHLRAVQVDAVSKDEIGGGQPNPIEIFDISEAGFAEYDIDLLFALRSVRVNEDAALSRELADCFEQAVGAAHGKAGSEAVAYATVGPPVPSFEQSHR